MAGTVIAVNGTVGSSSRRFLVGVQLVRWERVRGQVGRRRASTGGGGQSGQSGQGSGSSGSSSSSGGSGSSSSGFIEISDLSKLGGHAPPSPRRTRPSSRRPGRHGHLERASSTGRRPTSRDRPAGHHLEQRGHLRGHARAGQDARGAKPGQTVSVSVTTGRARTRSGELGGRHPGRHPATVTVDTNGTQVRRAVQIGLVGDLGHADHLRRAAGPDGSW